MPPIMVTTCWPTGNSAPGHRATVPAASMPRTRGNVTPDARPSRVCNSDRFSPKALTSISTQPAAGLGTGSSRIVSALGGPGASRTIARMVSVIEPSWLGLSVRLVAYTGSTQWCIVEVLGLAGVELEVGAVLHGFTLRGPLAG